MRRHNVSDRPELYYGFAWVVALVGGLTGCGAPSAAGDCSSLLSNGECEAVRTQLGRLDNHPPADPTNRFGRCVSDGSAECALETMAAQLGQRLFFDRCLSAGKNVGCVTCHDPGSAFIDSRVRPIQTAPVMTMVNGMPMTIPLPFIMPQNGDAVHMPEPAVQAMTDITGAKLAHWNADLNAWVPVNRRPQSSLGSIAMGAPPSTARQSPSLYNIAYGAVTPASDNARIAGTIWAPWDGRYDSHWALVADVFEFGGTQNTDRSHIALRIYMKHKAAYEAMTGTTMPDFTATDTATSKFKYPRHGSPGLANKCWFDAANCMDATSLPPDDTVRNNINDIFVNAGKALSAYMRRLRSNNSAYDRWMAGDPFAMNPSAQRGLKLFVGKAECILCHNGPNFTDSRFHNLGVPSYDVEGRIAGSALITTPADAQSGCFEGIAPNAFCPDPGRNGWQARASGQCLRDSAPVGGKSATCQRIDLNNLPTITPARYDIAMDCRGSASDATDKDAQCLPASVMPVSKCNYADQGSCTADTLCAWVDMPAPRCYAKSNAAELGQFKTPSLRNVALTYPYMHNGALFDYGPAENGMTTSDDAAPHLRRVVKFYANGGGTPVVGTLDPSIHKLDLSDADIDDVVEFLRSLTDNSLATDPLATLPSDLADVTDCPM